MAKIRHLPLGWMTLCITQVLKAPQTFWHTASQLVRAFLHPPLILQQTLSLLNIPQCILSCRKAGSTPEQRTYKRIRSKVSELVDLNPQTPSFILLNRKTAQSYILNATSTRTPNSVQLTFSWQADTSMTECRIACCKGGQSARTHFTRG